MIGILFRNGGKLLLAQRKDTGYHDGNYSLPAGHLDGNELATAAAAREAKEELDVDVDPADFRLAHVTHRLGTATTVERIELFFEVRKWQGEPRNAESHKCDHVAWYPVNDLPKNMIPQVRRVIGLIGEGVMYSEYSDEPTD